MTDDSNAVQTAGLALKEAVAILGGTLRSGQEKMCEAVAKSLEDKAKLLVQAGTGTGKSLGYLIPALLWAAQSNKGPVVVSTATIALQKQIMEKDAPLALKAIEALGVQEPKVALLKGWSNYVCLAKVGRNDEENPDLFESLGQGKSEETQSEQSENKAVKGRKKGRKKGSGKKSKDKADAWETPGSYIFQVRRAYEFARETETGDRDDLKPGVSNEAWSQVSLAKTGCPGERCSFFHDCFPAKARIQVQEAHLVVTNHAMLGIATANASSPLGDFGALIVDEAHDLVDRVRSQSTVSLSVNMLNNAARILGLAGVRETTKMAALASRLQGCLALMQDERITDNWPPELISILGDLALLVTGYANDLNNNFSNISKANILDGPQGLTQKAAGGPGRVLQPKLMDALSEISYLQTVSGVINPQATMDGKQVSWISRGVDGTSAPELYCAPLDVASVMANHLFEDIPVILTSATLAPNNNFAYTATQTGVALADNNWKSLDVGTPFNLPAQGYLYVACDVPPPYKGNLDPEAWECMLRLVNASKGGMLGLFTSNRSAQAAAQFLREETDYEIYLQGEDQTSALVQKFNDDPSACLVGTNSLWQGVDVPGLTNRLVVIGSIPFPVPTSPIIQARNEQATREGKNAFMAVSIPDAALMLAQGAGRLLRTKDDLGVVAVLDSRLRTKSYAKPLYRCLPQMYACDDLEQIEAALERLALKALGEEN